MTTFTNQSKNSTSATNQAKNTTTFTNLVRDIVAYFILLEDSFYLLQENGGKLIIYTENTPYINQVKN